MIDTAAARLQVPARSLRAVLRVECGSDVPDRWVAGDGRAIIRVEAHHVLRRLVGLPQRPPVLRVGSWYGARGGEPARPWEGHELLFDGAWSDYHRQDRAGGKPCEWDALDAATSILGDAGAAIECASWGPGQVMGAYWRTLGYTSAAGMAAAAASPAGGLALVCGYLERIAPPALAALRKGDFVLFARHYNGPGQAEHYGALLASAAARIS